jgi:hypothetical protein
VAYKLSVLVRHLDHLAKHDSGVAIEEGNTRQTFTVFEGVNHKRLGGLEHDLGHLIGLQTVGLLELLASSLLANLKREHTMLTNQDEF